MLSYKEYIRELFNKVYSYHEYNLGSRIQYEFYTHDNRLVTVVFVYGFQEFVFLPKSLNHGWEIFFYVENDLHVTGEGDSFAIFSTVIAIAKDFISKYNPDLLVFSSEKGEESRVELYSSLLKKLARTTDFAFNIPNQNSHLQYFVLYHPV